MTSVFSPVLCSSKDRVDSERMGEIRPMKERRKHCRVILNKPAWICNFDGDTAPGSLKDCLIVDISEGGACIQCSVHYEQGQPLAFIYQDFIENGLRPVVGTVMWSRKSSETDYRHGIKFLGLNTQMRHKIREQVSQLTSENADH